MTTITSFYWAARKGKKLGPFCSREEAEREGHALFPKRPRYRDCFSVGYGSGGPWFDIRFVNDTRRV